MPQLDPSSFASQLFWLLVAFVLLYTLLSRFMLPPLQEIIARRKSTLESDVDSAQRLKQEAETARADYERTLAEARGKAQQLMNEAVLAQKARAEEANRDLDKQVAAKLFEANKSIEERKQELLKTLTPAAAELAAQIIEKLTQRTPDSGKLQAAIGALSKARS